MELKDNPLLKPEDYMSDYKENIENLKNHPELISFDKLCYELFIANETGRKFIEYIKERYLLKSLANRDSGNYAIKVIWADGFKDFPRMIIQAMTSHEQRIKAGEKT